MATTKAQKNETEEVQLSMLGPKGFGKLETLFLEDEDFRVPGIKLRRDGEPKFELPDPTDEDEDNIKIAKRFQCAVLFFCPTNFKDDKKNAEKRNVYVLRLGQKCPERMVLSPSSTGRWKRYLKNEVKANGFSFNSLLVEVGGDRIKGEKHEWNVHTFKTVRPLTDEELDYVRSLFLIMKAHAERFIVDNADGIEEEMMGDDWIPAQTPAAKAEEEEDDDAARKDAKVKSRFDDEDEEDEAPKRGTSRRSKKDEEDEEDEAPKKGPASRLPDLDDED